jgi:hypothetical protein
VEPVEPMAMAETHRRSFGRVDSAARDQVVVDLTERVMSEAIRAVVRLENDGADANEAIRMVRAALTELRVVDTDLARLLDLERDRAEREDAPDDRELGGQG